MQACAEAEAVFVNIFLSWSLVLTTSSNSSLEQVVCCFLSSPSPGVPVCILILLGLLYTQWPSISPQCMIDTGTNSLLIMTSFFNCLVKLLRLQPTKPNPVEIDKERQVIKQSPVSRAIDFEATGHADL